MNINPEDEDFLFKRAPKRIQEMARRARSQRRVEARAEFMAQNMPEKQKGRGW